LDAHTGELLRGWVNLTPCKRWTIEL
jgi:hypothetical protein